MKHTSGFGSHPPVLSAQSLAREAKAISSPRESDEFGRNFSKLDLLVILLALAVWKIFSCQFADDPVGSIQTDFMSIAYDSARVIPFSGRKYGFAVIRPYCRLLLTI